MLQTPDLKRALSAAIAYFFVLFALGFVLGTIRVMLIEPRLGELAAVLVEVPVMLAAGFFACRWAVQHWQVPPVAAIRWAMVLSFLVLLLLVETALGWMLFGRLPSEQFAMLMTTAGLLGLSAQIGAALFPLLIDRGKRS